MPRIYLLVLVAASALAVPVQAGLTYNLRFADGTTTRKVNPTLVGQNIPIELWMASDSVTGNNGTGSLFGLQFAATSVISQRLLAGPNGSIGGDLNSAVLQAPFNVLGAQSGATADLNADGIGDLGSDPSLPSNTNYIRPRNGTAIFNDNPAATVRPITNGFEFLVASFTFHVDSVPATLVSGNGTRFATTVPTNFGTIAIANWWQLANGLTTGDGLNNVDDFNFIHAGTSVTFVAGSDWQNSARPLDVDNNTLIEPLDVLQVINDLNANGPRTLPAPSSGKPPPFLDTTGDGQVSPLDVLHIINFLNAQPPGALSDGAPPMVVVPEPGTAALAMLAGLGIIGLHRRRRAMRA